MKSKSVVFLFLSFIVLLVGCSAHKSDITREQIVEAYQKQGYTVWSKVYDEPLDHGEIAYIQADHPDGDYIYFSIFETEAQAKVYKKTYYHPAALCLFSVIYEQPSWPRWQVHGNILVQYDDPKFYDVFENLLKSK